MDKFKYYGDTYLRTRDLFDLLTPVDMMRVDPQNMLQILREKEIPYIINKKESLALMKIKEVYANKILEEAFKKDPELYDEIKLKMKKKGFKFIEDYMKSHQEHDEEMLPVGDPAKMDHYK